MDVGNVLFHGEGTCIIDLYTYKAQRTCTLYTHGITCIEHVEIDPKF